ILSLFFRPVKRKKAVKIGAGTRRACLERNQSEVVINAGDQLTPEEAEVIASVCDDEDDIFDESQSVHDSHVANTVRVKAIEAMGALGVEVSASELREAEMVMYKIAGLAKRVNDTAHLKAEFEILVDAAAKDPNSPITGEKRSLDRRVSTRWNSDLACLDAYFLLYCIIEKLTGVRDHKLQGFILTDNQRHLAEELRDILLVVEGPTQLFSQAEVPLIAEVIPMFLVIQQALKKASDDDKLLPILRISAYAGLLVCKKYYALTDECEAYYIAIVMSPDKKLSWFITNGFTMAEVQEIRKMAITRWEESYKKYQCTFSQAVTLQNNQNIVRFS
ncbi:uncharacterized protein FOMMEDRAFT_71609, partial [Fomitiporia mediterranea MF3/22]|uniref:uncharacterized protein n=1 Tax=Fomitiporia mediterranea (strain MF3/22) TaxID=694068 RepID=UPI00044074BE